jgi:hypothetical protein
MTDIVLNQHVPGGVMKQLGDAAGGIVYGQYTPGGCMGQLHTASGLGEPFDQYTPGGSYGQVEQELEGGSSAPAWVPADAIIHIDFLGGTPQGRAWTEADGEVGIETLLGDDDNTDYYTRQSEYDPAGIQEDGYHKPERDQNPPPAFIGAARAKLLAGATMRVQFLCNGPIGSTEFPIIMMAGTGQVGIDWRFEGTEIPDRTNKAGVASWTNVARTATAVRSDTLNCFALTITPTRGELAANGSSTMALALSEEDWPTSGADQINAGIVDVFCIQSITIHDPLPDTTGLPALSIPS